MTRFDDIFAQIIINQFSDFLLVRRRTWYKPRLPPRRVIDFHIDFEIFNEAGAIIDREKVLTSFREDATIINKEIDFILGSVSVVEFDAEPFEKFRK